MSSWDYISEDYAGYIAAYLYEPTSEVEDEFEYDKYTYGCSSKTVSNGSLCIDEVLAAYKAELERDMTYLSYSIEPVLDYM